MHRALAPSLFLPIFALLGADASADPAKGQADGLTPIEITMAGPAAVRIRVARGTTFPCDSANNQLLVAGKFERGQVIHLKTADRCVCLQQTYAPFPDVDWAPPGLVCRPQICKPSGRGKHCVPTADPTIRVSIQSTRPG